jgi:anti-anti-sigma regulatory factor
MPVPDPSSSVSTGVDRVVVAGPGLDVRFDFTPALLIARVTGRLRGSSRSHLPGTFGAALGRRPQRLLIDLFGLVTCDSAGLGVLVDAIDEHQEAMPTAISGLSPLYRRMLAVICADREEPIPVFEGPEEAVRVLRSMPAPPAPDPEVLLGEVRALHRAMLTHSAVNQARGVLMIVYRLDSEAASAMLVWHARRAAMPVEELSTYLLAAVQDLGAEPLTMSRADALLAELAFGRL